MSAYLFTGLISQFQKGRFAEWCASRIIYSGEEEACWKAFENFLLQFNQGDDVTPIKIEKMTGAPLLDQLLTEHGPAAINWKALSEEDWEAIGNEVQRGLETPPEDYSQAGYWADGNALVNPARLSPSIEALQQELPEETRSALNWSADRAYLFVVSVLSPPAPPPEPAEDFEEDDPARAEERELQERLMAFPEMARKEMAALVSARNLAVAAWLWRRYAASTPLASHAIRLDAWCGATPAGAADENAAA